MGLSIEIQKKPNKTDTRKIKKPTDVIELNEIKEIQNAMQEHLLLIGLDSANNIRTINLIGVGKSNLVNIDSKYIVRTALVTASERVILVHNHPSNSLEPSKQDKYVTNVVSKLLKVFNIEMLDHIVYKEHISQITTLLDKIIDWCIIDNGIIERTKSLVDLLK